MGDLNNEPDSKEFTSTIGKTRMYDPMETVPEEDRWTHYYYDSKGRFRNVSQLDYILLSPTLARKNKNPKVTLEKRGLLQTVWDRDGTGEMQEPFDGVSNKINTEGSDHAAMFVDLEI